MKHLLSIILAHTGWTKYRLGAKAGISKQLVQYWETKDSTGIELKHLVALKRAINVSWNELGAWIEEEVDKTNTRTS